MGARFYIGFVLGNPEIADHGRALVMAAAQNELVEEKVIPALRRLGHLLRGTPQCPVGRQE
eukprot:14188095-Alexandrium_andersonii.AAC.1